MPKAILFDLDGTLVQTRESSWRIFARTNEAFDLGIKTQEEYFRLMENNLFSSLRELAGSEERYRKISAHFLDLLKREYNPPFVPGMVDVIKSIAGTCSLAVVSSNATETIRRILTNAGLQHCFSHVFGGDVEPDKRACVRRFLADASYSINRQCAPAYVESDRPTGPNANQVILVTDTIGDVKHARECGIRTVGVSWGMHTEAQLLDAGAEFVAIWPQEIVAHLFPEGLGESVCKVEPATTGYQHAGFGSFDQSCGCHSGSSCGCGSHGDRTISLPRQSEALSRANAIRVERRQAAAETLTRNVAGNTSAERYACSPAESRNDDTLMSCLARIRGASVQAG